MTLEELKDEYKGVREYYLELCAQAEHDGMFSPLWEQASDVCQCLLELREEIEEKERLLK